MVTVAKALPVFKPTERLIREGETMTEIKGWRDGLAACSCPDTVTVTFRYGCTLTVRADI